MAAPPEDLAALLRKADRELGRLSAQNAQLCQIAGALTSVCTPAQIAEARRLLTDLDAASRDAEISRLEDWLR
jgi:hypothetical protein